MLSINFCIELLSFFSLRQYIVFFSEDYSVAGIFLVSTRCEINILQYFWKNLQIHASQGRQNLKFCNILPSSTGVWPQSELGCWARHRRCPKLIVKQFGYLAVQSLGTWGQDFSWQAGKEHWEYFLCLCRYGKFPRIIHFFTSGYYEDIRHQEVHFDLSCSLLSYTEYLKLLAFCTKGPVLL